MTSNEEQSFINATVGVVFRLGFTALLRSIARAKEERGPQWLLRYEQKVLKDVQRMKFASGISEALVQQTKRAVSAEVSQAFREARESAFAHGNGEAA